MAFNNDHRNWASEIALYLSKKDSEKTTRISGIFVDLWNAVGPDNAKMLIMHYVKQIRAGINATYPGRNMFNTGSVHKMKQKFINTLYHRLVRELVMPIIYAYFDSNVAPGAFVSTLVIAEDISRLRGVIVSDESVAVEASLRNLIRNVKYFPGAAAQIRDALHLGPLDNFVLDQDELEDSDGGFDSDGELPDYIPQVPLHAPNGDEEEQDDGDDWQEEINRNYLQAAQNQEIEDDDQDEIEDDEEEDDEIPPKDKEEADGEDYVPPKSKKFKLARGLRSRQEEARIDEDEDDELFSDQSSPPSSRKRNRSSTKRQ